MRKYERYKPSGIEWLGEIPEHWEVKRVKDILSNTKYPIKTGPFGSQLKGDDLKDEGVVCVYSQRNVIDNQFEEFKYFVDSNKAIELSAFKVKANDILITTRGTIGRASLLSDKCKIGILHPCLIALRINKKLVNYNFFLYYLNDSGVFQKYIASESNATTIEVIYSNTLNVFIKIIPPLSEQTAIS